MEYVRVTEYQQRGVPHYHGFMLNTDGYMRLAAKDAWFFLAHGFARVMPYDARRDARFYLAKYVVKDIDTGSIVFSRNVQRFSKREMFRKIEAVKQSPQVLALEDVFGTCDVLHFRSPGGTAAQQARITEAATPLE